MTRAPSPPAASAKPRRHWLGWVIVIAVLALALLALRWLAQPPRVSALIMNRAGAALGLEITARGVSEYRLRGTPMLVLRDVTAREPGAKQALLTAKRMHVELPWSTLRSGGDDLVLRRIELDAPQLDLPAFQHWQATRPPTAPRLPTLTHGLDIREGVVTHRQWRIDGIHAELARLDPAQPLHMRVRGRYVAMPVTAPVDLAVSLVNPQVLIKAGDSGIAINGRVTVQKGRDWRMPATLLLSGSLDYNDSGLSLTPARLGMAGTLEAGQTRAPFALGMHGPLRYDNAQAALTVAPMGLVVRGRGDAKTDLIPTVTAHGTLVLGERLTMQLDGAMAQWPQAWPALPPPIGQSKSSLPFTLNYDGALALTDIATLQVRRDATRFDGRFALPQMLDWIGQIQTGVPLPPMTGTLTTPVLEVTGARLEGVEIELTGDAEAP